MIFLFVFFVILLSIKMNKNGSMCEKHLILLILYLSLGVYLSPSYFWNTLASIQNLAFSQISYNGCCQVKKILYLTIVKPSLASDNLDL